jgi:hypothetical protein
VIAEISGIKIVCELIERNTLKELKISVNDVVRLNLIFNSMKKNIFGNFTPFK